MASAMAMTLPGGRAVPGWWRELSSLAPQRLWFAHLVLHRIEALVEVDSPAPLAAAGQDLLALLARNPNVAALGQLCEELSLEPALARDVLRPLADLGWVCLADESAELTPAGRASLVQQGDRLPRRKVRRVFHFADTRTPAFLPLAPSAATGLTPVGGWRFDLGCLAACIARPAEWKERYGFPPEVTALVRPGGAEPLDSLTVPMDRPEQALLLLVQTGSGRLLGLALQPETWKLGRDPVLDVSPDVDWLPALTGDVGLEGWRQAWHAWCQGRSLPGSDVEACRLEPAGHRLVVRPPARLMDRLRQMKSEALRGEAWLLGGSGRVRPAAVIELV